MSSATQPGETPDAMEVVLAFTSLDEYRSMGDDLAEARSKLNLPAWSTPTEVIAAALDKLATT